ncbi:MAG: hypothetical protein ACI9QN_000835 [Arcticibacterium sp.]
MSIEILIPIYKTSISGNELKSLNQCRKVLGIHSKTFIHPEGLDLTFYKESFPEIKFKAFDSTFFNGIAGYNRLLLSPIFYKSFDADYILIYQLDAWVFRDELLEWCTKGYDYVGAPNAEKGSGNNSCHDNLLGNNVLNGGLSLRNTKACLRAAKVHELIFKKRFMGNEDTYFSACYARFFFVRFLLKLPCYEIALKFAIEKNPREAFNTSKNALPFGCHAYEKYDYQFWKEHGL